MLQQHRKERDWKNIILNCDDYESDEDDDNSEMDVDPWSDTDIGKLIKNGFSQCAFKTNPPIISQMRVIIKLFK